MECKIVILFAPAGCFPHPEIEETKKNRRETVGGVYCYENGRAAFSRGCSTITNNVTWQSINAFNNILGAHEPRSTEQQRIYDCWWGGIHS